jgi:hypothetical protein
VFGVPSTPIIGKEAFLKNPHIGLKVIWMPQYNGRKKYVFLILYQLPMDQWTCQWQRLYVLFLVSLQTETLLLDPHLGGS